jgi:hypothetical protein
MMIKILLFLMLVLCSSTVAATAKELTIPFIVNSTTTQQSIPMKGEASSMQSTSAIKEIPTSEVATLIKNIKLAICKEAKDAKIKVWLSIAVDGKLNVSVIAVGANTKTGIEISLSCKKENK